MLLLIVFLAGAWAHHGAHSQNWHCLGPQPSFAGSCTEFGVPVVQQPLRVEYVPGSRPHQSDGNPQGVSELVRQALGER
jgi:hypothetical protein